MSTITQQQSTVDRQQASKLLKVSVRTIDRYIKSGRLPAYQKSGRILLHKSDIIELSKGTPVIKYGETESLNVIRGTSARGSSSFAPAQSKDDSQIGDSNFYKDLYEEAQKRLNEYQRKGEQSQERMNELENQVLRFTSQQGIIAANIAAQANTAATVVKHTDSNESFKIDLYKKDIDEKEKEIKSLKDLFEKEKANKTAFAIITYTLLALQPVFWYFLR